MKLRTFFGALLCSALLLPRTASAQDVGALAASIYRDFNVVGNAATGAYNPPKSDVRSLWASQKSINDRIYNFLAEYPGLNVNFTGIQSKIGSPPGMTGGLPDAWTFPHLEGSSNFMSAAVSGSVVTPAGTYPGTTSTWADVGGIFSALNYNANKSGVGAVAFAGVGNNGAIGAFGFNSIVVNCELAKPSCIEGGGYSGFFLAGGEGDVVVHTAAGGTAPTSGGVVGQRAALQASATAMTNVSGGAYDLIATSTGRWTNAFQSFDASAFNFASIGAQCLTGSCSSQGILLTAKASGSSVFAALTETSDGALNFTATGNNFNSPLKNTSGPLTLVGGAGGAVLVNSGFYANTLTDPGSGKANFGGYSASNLAGLSVTKTVRAGGGSSDCTETFTGGILTGSTCP
jgi:hypothetical protein